MRENPITEKFQEKDLEKVNEYIKSKNKKAVYDFFNCKCKNESRSPHKRDCDDCYYLYKEDIRVPNAFDCYVWDYIVMKRYQFSKS